jgi:hypothetical protein
MKFPKQLTPFILAFGLSTGVSIPEPAQAQPVQCYIHNGGSYHVCHLEKVDANAFVLVWQDGHKTAIVENRSQSGVWYDIAHANENGTVYGGGTRYSHTHYQDREWTCFHYQPGGRGKIDFCIASAN